MLGLNYFAIFGYFRGFLKVRWDRLAGRLYGCSWPLQFYADSPDCKLHLPAEVESPTERGASEQMMRKLAKFAIFAQIFARIFF
jgi:hypothetical protein